MSPLKLSPSLTLDDACGTAQPVRQMSKKARLLSRTVSTGVQPLRIESGEEESPVGVSALPAKNLKRLARAYTQIEETALRDPLGCRPSVVVALAPRMTDGGGMGRKSLPTYRDAGDTWNLRSRQRGVNHGRDAIDGLNRPCGLVLPGTLQLGAQAACFYTLS